MCIELGAVNESWLRYLSCGFPPLCKVRVSYQEKCLNHASQLASLFQKVRAPCSRQPGRNGHLGLYKSLSFFIGVSQNMAPDLNSTKDLFVFLGKSVFSVLEDMVFTLIPKPRKNVAGEIVLITGAGSGLGRLLALKFASLGSVLVLWDINKEGTEETCEMARAAGATRVYAYTCDCSQREEVYRVADEVNLECLLVSPGSKNSMLIF